MAYVRDEDAEDIHAQYINDVKELMRLNDAIVHRVLTEYEERRRAALLRRIAQYHRGKPAYE